jgi:hypothetical protein
MTPSKKLGKKSLSFNSLSLQCAVVVTIFGWSNSAQSQITKPHTFTSGQTISSAQVNANFDRLYQQVNLSNPILITTVGSSTVTVPTGASKIIVEAVGGGGGGSGSTTSLNNTVSGQAGGSGGYVKGIFTVSAGETINVSIGAGGAGGAIAASTCIGNAGGSGGNTTVTKSSGFTVTANGGEGAPQFYLMTAPNCYGSNAGIGGLGSGGFLTVQGIAVTGGGNSYGGNGAGGTYTASGAVGTAGNSGIAVISFY